MRIQLWHLLTLLVSVVIPLIVLYAVVRLGVRHGLKDADRK